MPFSAKIDYITMTKLFTVNPLQAKVISFFGAESLASDLILDLVGQSGLMVASKAQRFYAFTFECCVTAAMVSISDQLDTQGVRVVFSGKALQRHKDPKLLLERAIMAGWKITRLDLAVDAVGESQTVENYAIAYKATNGENRKKTWSVIHGADGDTLYIGSRKSARMMRVYDKAKEQGLDMDWVRFEMEYKDYAPMQASSQYLNDTGFVYREVLDMLNLPESALTAGLQEMAEGVEHETIKAPKTESARVIWFKGQVMQAFKKIVQDDPLEALGCLASLEETLLDQYEIWMNPMRELPAQTKSDKLDT